MDKSGNLKPGMLLVSDPYANDMFFHRSVVMLAEYNDEGSVGFVLNKALAYKICDLVEGFPDCDFRISLGGPVGHNTLNFLHVLGNVMIPHAQHIGNGIYWGGDFGALSGLIGAKAISSNDLLFFLGYSGWSVGQLENEIAEGAWAVIPSERYDIMNSDDDLWYRIVYNEPSLFSWRFIPEHPEDN